MRDNEAMTYDDSLCRLTALCDGILPLACSIAALAVLVALLFRQTID